MAEGPVKVDFATGFPDKDAPVIFADGTAGFVNSQEVTKTTFVITEGNISDPNAFRNRVVAQIVMPVTALVSTFVMYEQAVERFVANGLVSQETVDKMRAVQLAIGPKR